MTLLGIARFELGYQLRRPWPWLTFAVLAVVCFLFTRQGALADALYEDFYLNSPFLVASATVFGGIVWLLMGPPVAGEAAARDVGTGMYPLVYASSVRRRDYLGGRFLAALALNALVLLGITAGNLLAAHLPGVHPDAVGPFRPAAYLTPYAFIALPNAFVATALQFAAAVRSGRATSAYLGSLVLLFLGFFVASILLFQRGAGTLLDPVGIRFVVEDLAHEWTTVQKRSALIALEGTLLRNRLLWVAIGTAVLGAAWASFRFAHRADAAPWWRRIGRRPRIREDAPASVPAAGPGAVPHVPRRFGPGMEVRRTLSGAWTSFRFLAGSWAGMGVLVGIPLLTVPVILDQMASGGAPLIPTTIQVTSELTAPLAAEMSRWIIVPLLVVFFAGELVWRERDAGVGEITDAMPGSEWPRLLGKLLGLALLLALLLVLLMGAGMLAQALMGHRDVQPGLYLGILLGLQLPEYLLFAVLAVAVHVLVDHKYAGHLAAVGAWLFIVLASLFGIRHNLLIYGGGPAWSVTEMRGFGASLGPWAWFRAYWAAWAVLLAVAARLLWVRGRERGIRVRLRMARHRLTRPTLAAAAAAVALIASLGGFILYNTTVLNPYVGQAEATARRAEYERRYGRFADAPQPSLTDARLGVEIHPARRAVDVRGVYRLVNETGAAIDSIHLSTAPSGAETRGVAFDRAARLAVDDDAHGYRIYRLHRPLAPGDTLRMHFRLRVERRGFGNAGIDPSVVEGGSHFTSGAWFPFVGYQRHREVAGAGDRREHGLPPRPVVASLYEVAARGPASRGGGVHFHAVVGTDADEVAVAPGALRRTWTENGRRYSEYATDAPIGTEWTFASADYAVHAERWRGVEIRVFHHPGHAPHVERILRGVRASLDHYGREFGPYPYGHLTLAELPRIGTGMHADPAMITFTEGTALWNPPAEGLDFPFAIVAHEMAHQWTVPYAFAEGAPVLSEGVAWYYALQAVEAARGPHQLRRLLAFMRQPHPYAPIRRGEPLLRGLDPYMSYRRAPFALYTLGEYAGQARVNAALRRLVEAHGRPGAPLATTLDLYRELRAAVPDSLHPLLHDLFEVNTYWNLSAERVAAARTADGDWRVTMDVRARKVVFDSAGGETEVPMDAWVEVGVYPAAAEGGPAATDPLYLRRHRVRTGAQRITVTVPDRPRLAGIDPRHLLVSMEPGDRVREVDAGEADG